MLSSFLRACISSDTVERSDIIAFILSGINTYFCNDLSAREVSECRE